MQLVGLNNGAPSSLTNTGGTIAATGANSTVTLNEVTITDGTLTTSSGGVILQSGGTSGLAGSMTLKGTLNVADNNALILSGVTLTNNGALNLNSSSHDTDLVVAGGTTVTLNGTGSVNLTGTGTPRIYGSGYNATLNNQETIQGAGRIDEDGEFALNNSGTIDANVSGGTLGLGIGLGGLSNGQHRNSGGHEGRQFAAHRFKQRRSQLSH